MLLEGSCHCGAIRFRVRSAHPYPFNLCYCRDLRDHKAPSRSLRLRVRS